MSSPLRIVEVCGPEDDSVHHGDRRVVMVLSWHRRLRIGGTNGCDIELRESPLRRASMAIGFKLGDGAASEDDLSGAQLLLEFGSGTTNAVLINGMRVVVTNHRRPTVRLRVGDVIAFVGSRRSFVVEWCGPLPMPPNIAPAPTTPTTPRCQFTVSPLRAPEAMRAAVRRHSDACSPLLGRVSPLRQHRPLAARHVDAARPSLFPDSIVDHDAILLEEAAMLDEAHSIAYPLCPASSLDMLYHDPLTPCAPPSSLVVAADSPLSKVASAQLLETLDHTTPSPSPSPPRGGGHHPAPPACRVAPLYLCCTDGGGRALLPVATHHQHEHVGNKEQLITARGAAHVMHGLAVRSSPEGAGPQNEGKRKGDVRVVGSYPPSRCAVSPLLPMPSRFIELLVHRYDKGTNRFEPYDAHVAMLSAFATRIITAASAILEHEQPIVSVASPAWCCGDLHGSFADVLFLMEQGLPFGQVEYQTHPFVFLGDYVDRGEHSVEVALLLLAWKMIQPTRLVLLRGNHEDPAVNGDDEQYGDTSFRRKCISVLGQDLGDAVWAQCNQAFATLPVAAVMDRSIFLCHGGVPHFGHINATLAGGGAAMSQGGAAMDVARLFSRLVSEGAAMYGDDPSLPTAPHPLHEAQDTNEDAASLGFFGRIPSLMPQVEDDTRLAALRQLARELVWNDPCPSAAGAYAGGSSPDRDRTKGDATDDLTADTRIGAPPCAVASTHDATAIDTDGFRCNIGRGDTEGIIHEYSNKAVEGFLAAHGWSLLLRAHQHKAYGIEVIHHAQVITLFSSCNYANANAAGACFVREGTVHLVSWHRAPMSPPRGRGSESHHAAPPCVADVHAQQPPMLWSCGLLPSSAHLTIHSLGFAPSLAPQAVAPPLQAAAAPQPTLALPRMPALEASLGRLPAVLAPDTTAPLLEAVLRVPARCEKPKATAASPPPRVPPPAGSPTAPTHRRRKTICG